MRLAQLLGWSPTDVNQLSSAELAAATEAANYQAKWPPQLDLLAAIFEQLNALYILTWYAHRDPKKKSAKPPKEIKVPRPYDKQPEPKKKLVVSPAEFSRMLRDGEFG